MPRVELNMKAVRERLHDMVVNLTRFIRYKSETPGH